MTVADSRRFADATRLRAARASFGSSSSFSSALENVFGRGTCVGNACTAQARHRSWHALETCHRAHAWDGQRLALQRNTHLYVRIRLRPPAQIALQH